MEEDTGPGGAYARLEERGLRLKRFREEITIRMPTPEEARGLHLGPGIPVAELYRIAYTDERPLEVFRAIMSGDSHTFAYDFDLPE
jgi:GntR family transcriptional regulator